MNKLYINRVAIALTLCIILVLYGIIGMIMRDVQDYRVYLMFGGVLIFLLYSISREPIYSVIENDGIRFRHSSLRISEYRFTEIAEVVYPYILRNERNVSAIRILTNSGRVIVLHDSFGDFGKDLKQLFPTNQAV